MLTPFLNLKNKTKVICGDKLHITLKEGAYCIQAIKSLDGGYEVFRYFNGNLQGKGLFGLNKNQTNDLFLKLEHVPF